MTEPTNIGGKLNTRLLPKFQSLKFRLMLLITLMLVFVVGLPIGFFVYQLDKNYREFSTNLIETTSQIVYQNIFDSMMRNDSVTIQRSLELFALVPTIKKLRIYRPNGTIIYSSHKSEVKQNVYQIPEGVSRNTDKNELESFSSANNLFIHRHPIYIQKECTACHGNQGAIIAIMDVRTEFTDSEHLYVMAKKMSIIGAILIVVILWILTNMVYQSQIEARLLTIIHGFDELAKGNFDFKIQMPGRHELAALAAKFNDTVGKLKTARKKEEQAYQERLERADRLVTLGEVAAEIAHEVNNPAGNILIRTEFIKEELGNLPADNPIMKNLNIIGQQTKKIADITRSILHYARKLPRSFATTDLNGVIRHSIEILSPRITKQQTKIELHLPPQPAIVWGNFSQLEQVFCNMINNSLDVLPEMDGKIEIAVSCETNETGMSIYLITYQDNGPGIAAEYQNQIFSPFFTTKAAGEGTGLGLFIAKNIISNHNGKIFLQENPANGACFVLELAVYQGS